MSHEPGPTLYTLGHSNRPIDAFLELLARNRIEIIADVRAFPGSRHNPQYQSAALRRLLNSLGVSYRHFPDLGGRRSPVKHSRNTGWLNKSFQGYADHLRTAPFQQALHELIGLASERRTAILCAEAVPWRCHRNLISDALTVEGIHVEHILSRTRNQPHRITPWAKVRGHIITYGDNRKAG